MPPDAKHSPALFLLYQALAPEERARWDRVDELAAQGGAGFPGREAIAVQRRAAGHVDWFLGLFDSPLSHARQVARALAEAEGIPLPVFGARCGDDTPPPSALGSWNRFMVGAAGGRLVCLLNPPARRAHLTKEDALCLCAWLSVVAEISDEELLTARREVEST